MDIQTNKCSGTIKISEDVIIDIASNVINEIDGISEYNKNNPLNFGNKPAITVNFNSEAVEITVLLNAELGCNVLKCAEDVQKKIKSCVQDMTQVMVSKVNVKFISIL